MNANFHLGTDIKIQTRGILIVFEGLDHCGKTTQLSLLEEKFKNENIKFVTFKFPDRTTPIGQMIDSYLKEKSNIDDKAIHLLFSANRWELFEKIQKNLLEGATVLLDRYLYSGIAFSSAKGLNMEWCVSCDRGLILPDLVIFLSVPVDEIAKRKGFGEERYERKQFQQDVLRKFNKLYDPNYWAVVNGMRSKEAIHDDINMIVMGKYLTNKYMSSKPFSPDKSTVKMWSNY